MAGNPSESKDTSETSKPWPSCRPRLLEKQAKKQNWNSWPSCRPGPQKKKKQSWISWFFLPSCRPGHHQKQESLALEELLSCKQQAKPQARGWLAFAPLWLPACTASFWQHPFSTFSHGWEGTPADLQSFLPKDHLSIRWCCETGHVLRCIASAALQGSHHWRFCRIPLRILHWSAHLWHSLLWWLFFCHSHPAWRHTGLWHQQPCQWCFAKHQCPLVPQ